MLPRCCFNARADRYRGLLSSTSRAFASAFDRPMMGMRWAAHRLGARGYAERSVVLCLELLFIYFSNERRLRFGDLEIGSLGQHILETGSLIVYRSRSPVDVAYLVRKAQSTRVRTVFPSLLSRMIRVRLGIKVLFFNATVAG